MFLERCCVICTEPTSYDFPDPICRFCDKSWKEFLKIKCRNCGREIGRCTCLPRLVRKVNHSIACWCVFYDAGANGDVSTLFTNLKTFYDRELISMCAERMKKSLLSVASQRNINLKEYVVTFAPRRKRNVRKYGFDQSEKLSKALGKMLGIPSIKTLENLAKREQKGLNKTDRLKNATTNYEYIEGSLGEYKKVILVDDIMTSGATFYACAFQLYSNGATEVIPVAFAKDNHISKGDRNNVKRNSKYNFTGAVKSFVRNGSQ